MTTSSSSTANTCGSTGTLADTVLSIHDTCGGDELACSDDACGFYSEATVQMEPDEPFHVRVADYSGDGNHGGTFTLDLDAASTCVSGQKRVRIQQVPFGVEDRGLLEDVDNERSAELFQGHADNPLGSGPGHGQVRNHPVEVLVVVWRRSIGSFGRRGHCVASSSSSLGASARRSSGSSAVRTSMPSTGVATRLTINDSPSLTPWRA